MAENKPLTQKERASRFVTTEDAAIGPTLKADATPEEQAAFWQAVEARRKSFGKKPNEQH